MRFTRRSVVCLVPSLGATAWRTNAAETVTIFAAVSLTDVMRRLETSLGTHVRFSFAASSTLARQIEQGAPAQIFASADEAWMDHLQRLGRIREGSRRVFAANRLVVIAPTVAGDAVPRRVGGDAAEQMETLRAALGLDRATSRIATGDPAHVPAGRYAESALRSLGLWQAAAERLVRAENVRSALLYVERGEAQAGIVYATDAAISNRVRVLGRFPARSHPPIVYPAALLAGAGDEARVVFERLFTPAARAALLEAGFVTVT